PVKRADLRAALQPVGRRQAPYFLGRPRVAIAVRRTGVALLREIAVRVHDTEILPAVGIDDHRRLERRRIVRVLEEEILTVAFECDFYEMHCWLLVTGYWLSVE